MKILYGINGVGNGHIIKSTNIIHELKKLGIEVDILLSGNNHELNIPFNVKWKFEGVSFFYNKEGSIDYVKTIKNLNIIKFIKNLNIDVKSYDKVVTDFEPITAWACKLNKKDCIGISHQYSFLSKETPRPNKKSIIGEIILDKLSPVTNPLGLHFEMYDTFIKHPVIRGDLKILTSSNNKYYTIYLPSFKLKTIVDVLLNYKETKFEIFSKDVKKSVEFKNIKIYPNSRYKFVDSFINSEGIITSAGFETPSEALFLKKKLMVIPIRGQYEQICNGESLRRMGVFVGSGLNDIKKFLEQEQNINWHWKDPMPEILNLISN